MLEVEDEGDSVEFGGGGEGRDFARRPIKRKIHKGVKGGTGGQEIPPDIYNSACLAEPECDRLSELQIIGR